MKKIIISIITSFLVLFLVWCIQGYSQYGDEFVNYRVDIKRTIETLDTEFLVEDTIGTIQNLRDSLIQNITIEDEFLSAFVEALTFLVMLAIGFAPVVFSLLGDIFTFIILIIDFIFNPKFILIK